MTVYNGNKLSEISFPIGGIGSGSIGLCGNGTFSDFEIFGRPSKKSRNGFTHLAVRVFDGEKIADARVLCSDMTTELCGRVGANLGSGVQTETMVGFPHFRENDFSSEYPFACLSFNDEHFPGRIKLCAFNPIIPLDSKHSSLPAAFFELEITNTLERTLTFEGAFSVCNPFPLGINEVMTEKNGVTLKNANNLEESLSIVTEGTVDICDFWQRGWRGSFYRDNVRTYWQDFSSGKPLAMRNYKELAARDHCTVSSKITLSGGETGKLRFVLSWSIPTVRECNKHVGAYRNYYSTVFPSSRESALYCLENMDMLEKETRAFTDALYSSSVDDSVKQAIESALSVIKTPTAVRLENGDFYGWEGIHQGQGSCEGLCQHVWSYAYLMCYLFPELERSVRNNTLAYGVFENGESSFRLPLPFDSGVYVNLFNPGQKFVPCVDGHMGEIIKVYREWKISGNTEWLKDKWEIVKRMLRYATSSENPCEWDRNRDGVIEGRQHHTLDCELFGPNGWLQGFYLAALKAGAEMAESLSDYEAKDEFSELFEKGREYLKNNLFNGEYFIQMVDLSDLEIPKKYGCEDIYIGESGEVNYQIKEGCLIDQCIAQWHALLCGLGDIFDSSQTKTALQSIFKYNYMPTCRGLVNPWRIFMTGDESGTIMCSYPRKDATPKNPLPYSEEVMSGFEYAFAGLLIAYGLEEEALTVIRAVRDRYDGEKRNPYNDIECGNNYARSMAAYALLPLYLGFYCDMTKGLLHFRPRFNKESFSCIWNCGTGYGVYSEDGKKITVKVIRGVPKVSVLSLPRLTLVNSVSVNGKLVEYQRDGDKIIFDEAEIVEIIIVKGE